MGIILLRKARRQGPERYGEVWAARLREQGGDDYERPILLVVRFFLCVRWQRNRASAARAFSPFCFPWPRESAIGSSTSWSSSQSSSSLSSREALPPALSMYRSLLHMPSTGPG
jgi:hypothetical protein